MRFSSGFAISPRSIAAIFSNARANLGASSATNASVKATRLRSSESPIGSYTWKSCL